MPKVGFRHSEETKEKLRQLAMGVVRSDEYKAKMSENTKRHWDSDAGSYGCLVAQKVKILSPDNNFFSISAHEVMKCEPKKYEYCVGEVLVRVLPGKVKQYIIDNFMQVSVL